MVVCVSNRLTSFRSAHRITRAEGTERRTGKAGKTSHYIFRRRRVFRHIGHGHVEDIRIPRHQVQRRASEHRRSL